MDLGLGLEASNWRHTCSRSTYHWAYGLNYDPLAVNWVHRFRAELYALGHWLLSLQVGAPLSKYIA